MDGSSTAPGAVETHISTVCFVGDRAYKLLKPLQTGFLDHSTRQARKAAIERELELNRRLARDVYLGVGDLVEEGEVVDHVLVMRRLPAERRMSALVDDPCFDDCLRDVARQVAAFHAGLPPSDLGAAMASRTTVAKRWKDNLAEMAEAVGPVLPAREFDEVARLARRYLGGRAALFEQRIAQGFAREGHGDLLAEDIFCTEDGPRILDCLAFNDALRCGDVLNDVAFLVMDLERIAGPAAAMRFLRWYSEFSNEHHPSSLAHHYVAYRANVRTKVSCIRHEQGAAGAADEARTYQRLALDHLRRARVRVVLVGGAPGTGKTTLAAALGDTMRWPVLSSDEHRKDLTETERTDHASDTLDEGIYHPDVTEQVYDDLIDRTERLVELGESVILDASWSRERLRSRVRSRAERRGADVVELRCDVAPAVAAERIAERLRLTVDASDATPELAERLAARFEPWPEATAIDTAETIGNALALVLDAVEDRPKVPGSVLGSMAT